MSNIVYDTLGRPWHHCAVCGRKSPAWGLVDLSKAECRFCEERKRRLRRQMLDNRFQKTRVLLIRLTLYLYLCSKHRRSFSKIIEGYHNLDTDQYECQVLSCKQQAKHKATIRPTVIIPDETIWGSRSGIIWEKSNLEGKE